MLVLLFFNCPYTFTTNNKSVECSGKNEKLSHSIIVIFPLIISTDCVVSACTVIVTALRYCAKPRVHVLTYVFSINFYIYVCHIQRNTPIVNVQPERSQSKCFHVTPPRSRSSRLPGSQETPLWPLPAGEPCLDF